MPKKIKACKINVWLFYIFDCEDILGSWWAR